MQFLITVLIPAFIEFLHNPYLFSDHKIPCIHLLEKELGNKLYRFEYNWFILSDLSGKTG